jgi:hypothetical protein
MARDERYVITATFLNWRHHAWPASHSRPLSGDIASFFRRC